MKQHSVFFILSLVIVLNISFSTPAHAQADEKPAVILTTAQLTEMGYKPLRSSPIMASCVMAMKAVQAHTRPIKASNRITHCLDRRIRIIALRSLKKSLIVQPMPSSVCSRHARLMRLRRIACMKSCVP